tara:strand:+ start:1128 stop:1940 length:813 start_codon:yes stop_codon:yes gene_type:complete
MRGEQQKSLVSVILPNYNSAKYINLTIDSISNQSYSNLEIIIVDNGSTDNSLDLIKLRAQEDNRIKLIELSQNSGGPALPRNVGITEALGSHLAFIDSDDIWHNDKISIQMNVVKNYKAQFVACENKVFYTDSNILVDKIYTQYDIEFTKISFHELLKKNTLGTSGVLIDQKLLKNLRFNEDKKYVAIEDYLLWLQIHEVIDYSYLINLPLLYYRKSSDSLSPANSKIFIQKIWMFSLYKFFNKQHFFFRIQLIISYITKSLISFIFSKK